MLVSHRLPAAIVIGLCSSASSITVGRDACLVQQQRANTRFALLECTSLAAAAAVRETAGQLARLWEVAATCWQPAGLTDTQRGGGGGSREREAAAVSPYSWCSWFFFTSPPLSLYVWCPFIYPTHLGLGWRGGRGRGGAGSACASPALSIALARNVD